MINQM